MSARLGSFLAAALLAGTTAARADTAAEVYKVMGIRTGDVLSGSVLTARVLPGGSAEAKQVVALVTYMTGKRDEAQAINVRLAVFRREGDALAEVYARDLGKENSGHVGRGDLELVDLDGDGANEIVLSYDTYKDPLVQERRADVILQRDGVFAVAWTGPVSYDATKAVRTVPVERRDRFTRALDIPGTLKTRGVTLMVKKTVVAVAGERLEQPRVLQETFPLRSTPSSS